MRELSKWFDEAWLRQGEWVPNHTRRGSPRTGVNAKRWRTNRDRRDEFVIGIVCCLLMVAPIAVPILGDMLGFWVL